MEEATHVAVGMIAMECLSRLRKCDIFKSNYNFCPGIIFVAAYLLCMSAILVDLKSINFFQSPSIKFFIKLLHSMDGFIALLMGVAMCLEKNDLFLISILCITKCFLLYLLSRMVTGVHAHSTFSIMLQATKTFIHHTGSFYFIADPDTALLTGIWRCVSMNGHAVLAFKESLSEETFDRLMWIITHSRNAVMIWILYLCITSASIRQGFGK
jgi:hypothetical protein